MKMEAEIYIAGPAVDNIANKKIDASASRFYRIIRAFLVATGIDYCLRDKKHITNFPFFAFIEGSEDFFSGCEISIERVGCFRKEMMKYCRSIVSDEYVLLDETEKKDAIVKIEDVEGSCDFTVKVFDPNSDEAARLLYVCLEDCCLNSSLARLINRK